MKLDGVKKIIAAVAPTLATALGGPLAGAAARSVAEAILGKEAFSEEELANAVANATPDQLLALKKADYDFKISLQKLEVDLERIAMQDRDSARRREAMVKDRVPAILALLTMVSFFGYIAAVTFMPLAVLKDDFINLALGWLGGSASTVIAYYFGSSAGRDSAVTGGPSAPK